MHKPVNKKALFLILSVFSGIIILLSAGIAGKVINLNRTSILKSLTVLNLNDNTVNIPLNQRDTTIIIVFNFECEFCNLELNELISNYELFKNFRIFLLSVQPVDDLARASEKYKLDQYPGIHLFRMSEETAEDPVFSVPTPSLFVYDPGGRLIVSRKGYAAPLKMIRDLRHEKNK